MLLAGDVGGTKTVLALYDVGVGTLQKTREAVFQSATAPSLTALVQGFLREAGAPPPRAACFGVPGAVIDGVCRTTNLPWLLDEAVLAGDIGAARVKLINDLQAAAVGVLHLDDSERCVLQPGRHSRKNNVAVIAAGTGLGEAFLFFDGARHHPSASEGGHASFAPGDEVEIELLRFLQRRHGAHVSWERILSGPGLGALYDFMASRGDIAEGEIVRDKMKTHDKGSVVGLHAVNGTDALCVATARLFCRLYGSEAGNLALKGLTTGGVHIAGGIAPKLLPLLQGPEFLQGFTGKGRFSELLRGIEVSVALNDKTPLLGAAHYAAQHLA